MAVATKPEDIPLIKGTNGEEKADASVRLSFEVFTLFKFLFLSVSAGIYTLGYYNASPTI